MLLGTTVVPFSRFDLGVSLLKLNIRTKGTLIIKVLLRNLVFQRAQKGGNGGRWGIGNKPPM